MPSHLLAQFEEFGRREAPAGHGLLPPDFVALRGTVGRYRLTDLVAPRIADPEKLASVCQGRAAAAGNKDRQDGKKGSH
ncbi:hypothetical protein GmRootV59_28100 [Variovorax sp. V59]